MLFLYLLSFLLLSVSLYLLAADRLQLPSILTTKAVLSFSQKKKRITPALIRNDLSVFFSRFVKLNPYKKARITADLKALGETMTAETYTVQALLHALRPAVLAIPITILLPIGNLALLFWIGYRYFSNMRRVDTLTQKKRESIEAELPRFVSTIEKAFSLNHNVVSILDRYRHNASKEFADELSITVADMRSGSEEVALLRLEGRVGSSALSDVVRGLISVIRGDDNKVYWHMLSIKLADMQRQQLMARAKRMPAKINRLTAVIFFFLIAILLNMLIYEIYYGAVMLQ